MKFSGLYFFSFVLFFGVSVECMSAEDTGPVLISYDGLSISQNDLDEFLAATLAEDVLLELRSDEGRMRRLILDYFTTRALAYEAKKTGLSEEEGVRARLSYESDKVLAGLYLDKQVSEIDQQKIEKVAYEQYLANIDRYETPEKVSVSHILVEDVSPSEELVNEILAKIDQGEDFSSLAMEYSDDSSVKSNRGNLGYFAKGEMVPEFEEAAFSLTEEGEVIGPIKTQFGMHIIRFNGREESRTLLFDDVKVSLSAQVERQLKNQQRRELVDALVNSDKIITNHEAVDNYVKP